ncbi:MAG: nucleotidyltransferase family protein [Hormoscilla sp.]
MKTKTSALEQVVTAVETLSSEEQRQLFERLQKRIDPKQARQKQAWEFARTLANLLREKYGATRVVVFGSLLDRTGFNPNADIELAVWGIPDRVYFKAMGQVTSSSEFLVEMLDQKICSPWLWQLIEKDGVEV